MNAPTDKQIADLDASIDRSLAGIGVAADAIVRQRDLAASQRDILAVALRSLAYQSETIAGLADCGEVNFLRGIAKVARAALRAAGVPE